MAAQALPLFLALMAAVASGMSARPTSQQKPLPGIYLVTFGRGQGYGQAQHRLAQEANRTGLFNGVFNYDSLPDFITSDGRWKEHLQVSKGAGYWFWKAALVKHLLSDVLQEGDALVYADAGCELGTVGGFVEIAKALCRHDLATFALWQDEAKYTKGEVFTRFGVAPHDPFYGSHQVHATYFAIKNTPASRRFVEHWENLMADLRLIDLQDRQSNSPDFVAHRSDQSLLSLLVKANMPEVHDERTRRHYPDFSFAQRHPEFGIEGFRPLIMQDAAYPPDPAKSWICASRNIGGTRRHMPQPQRLLPREAAAIRRRLGRC